MSGRKAKARRREAKAVLALLPCPPDDGTVALKNGIVLRNRATLEGCCPACGAVFERCAPPPGHPLSAFSNIEHVAMPHESWCPAATDEMFS